MRSYICIALLLIAQAAAQAPAPAPLTLYQRPQNGDCVSQVRNDALNYFPAQLRISGSGSNPENQTTVTVAQDFNVTYFDNYKVVTNRLANETYVLYQCGTAAPSSSVLPAGSKVFSVPLTSVAVLETVPIAFLELLGVMSRLESVSSFAVGSCGQKLLNCSKAAPDSFTSSASAIQAQLLPLTDAIVTSSSSSNDLTTLAFSASQDPGVLNRAEWIKFLGMFFNLDGAATQTFNSINASYYQTKANISSQGNDQPTLAFISLYSYAPDTAFVISLSAYKQQYARDAGAQNLNVTDLLKINGTILAPTDPTNSTVWFAWNRTGSGFPSRAAANAAFKDAIDDVDVVIDETYALNPLQYNISTFYTTYNITADEQDDFDFIEDNAVYREDRLTSGPPSYGLDWFEGAIARPDRVLLDFAQAVDPSSFPSHTRVWLRRLSTNETTNIVTLTSCNQVQSCSQPLTPICPLVSTCSDGAVVAQQNATSTCQYAACSA